VLGEITLFTIDTLLTSGANGLTVALAPEEIRLTVLGMSGLIGLNIIAIFAFHIFDSENMKAIDQHFREVKERKAEDKIADAITDAKVAKAESISDELATREADNFANEQRRKDRVNHALPSMTLGEKLREVKAVFSPGAKSGELPLVAAETVGIPKLKEPVNMDPALIALAIAEGEKERKTSMEKYGDRDDQDNPVYFWDDGAPRYMPEFGYLGERWETNEAGERVIVQAPKAAEDKADGANFQPQPTQPEEAV
ncbi:MAG: hypothetical protein R8K20_09890, partial [Gallionellaceae bacterium]